jgi:hypothetical protein
MMPLYCLFNLSFLGLRGRHKPTRRRDRISEQEPAEVRPPSFGIVVRPSGTVSSNPLPSSGESDANSAQSWPHVALVLLAALGFEDPGSSVAFSCGNRSLKAIEQRRVSRRRSAEAHTAGVDRQIPLGIRTWLRSHASFAKSQGWRQEPTERGSALAQYHLTTTRVPIMRNQPLRSDAPRCGWQTIAAEVPAQKGSSSSSQNAT